MSKTLSILHENKDRYLHYKHNLEVDKDSTVSYAQRLH